MDGINDAAIGTEQGTHAEQDDSGNTARYDHPLDDPTLALTEVTHSSWHTALGLRLRYDTNDARIHAAVLESFGPSDVDPGPAATVDAHVQLFVQHVDEAPGFRPRQPVTRSFGPLFTMAASRASVVGGDASSGQAFGFVSPTVVSHRDYLRSTFVQAAFFQIAQRRSLVAVHAACLWKDGRAIMVRGDSGAGKSTLCYAALRLGWSLIAEDVVYLRTRRPHAGGPVNPADVEVHDLPWTLHLLPDAVRLFPELRTQPQFERPDGRVKLGVQVAQQFPGQTQHHTPLCPVVFVTRGDRGQQAPSLRLLERDEARARLAATAIHYEQAAERDFAVWDAFLTQPCYVLTTSDDPLRSAAALERVPPPMPYSSSV